MRLPTIVAAAAAISPPAKPRPGAITEAERPSTSAAAWPNIRSAAGLNPTIRPASSMVTKASSEASRTAALRSSLSLSASMRRAISTAMAAWLANVRSACSVSSAGMRRSLGSSTHR